MGEILSLASVSVGRNCQAYKQLRILDPVFIVCILVLYSSYLKIAAPRDRVLRESCSFHRFGLIGNYRFTCLAIVLRLWFRDGDLPVFRHALAIFLARFAMVVHLSFSLPLPLTFSLRDCDFLAI